MSLNREVIGRTSLLNFLSSNHDVLSVCVDQCYSKDAAVAKAYFQVHHAPHQSHDWAVMHAVKKHSHLRTAILWHNNLGCQSATGVDFISLQVLTEVYMTKEIQVQPHTLLSLILCKLGDASLVIIPSQKPVVACHLLRREELSALWLVMKSFR